MPNSLRRSALSLRPTLASGLRRGALLALAALGLALALAVGLSACGGSDEKVVAMIGGSTKVTQATLNHWMGVVLGGDYEAARSEEAPAGLVSDPPRYSRCVAVSEGIVPKAAGKPALDAAQRLVKCRQLDKAIKEQALNYVLSVLWSREEAKKLGIAMPSEAQISTRLRLLIYNQFKNPAYFRKVIASERRSIADVRFLIKRNILETQIYARIKARAKKLGGPEQATIYKLVLANNARWQKKTSCSLGYRAWECKEYGSAGEAKPQAAVVLEYFQKGVG